MLTACLGLVWERNPLLSLFQHERKTSTITAFSVTFIRVRPLIAHKGRMKKIIPCKKGEINTLENLNTL
jgi:hypothetical protein